MNQKIIYFEKIKKNLEFYNTFNKQLVIMVKADAYGHGIEQIAKLLSSFDVILGVATLTEAINLRKFWKEKILIVEPLHHFEGIDDNLEFCVEDYDAFMEAQKLNLLERCYIKINTGMNRFGFKYNDKILKKIGKNSKKIKIKGLMTHFSCLDDRNYTNLQYERFKKVRKYFREDIDISFGGSNVCSYNFDYTQLRIGIGFYGYENEKVYPIMKIKSQILNVKMLQAGEELGYGNNFVAEKKTKIAVVGLGYGDGIRRDLKGFYVKVNDQNCKIIGNICMDCFFIDITNILCNKGDEVILERADLTANYLDTISYEILTGYSKLRAESVVYE